MGADAGLRAPLARADRGRGRRRAGGLLLLLSLPGATLAQSPAEAPWRAEEVGEGVVWKSHRFESLFGAPQSVNLLEVDLSGGAARIRIAAADGRERTSALASRTRAVAAVNGGYFEADGTPVGRLVSDGVIVSTAARPTHSVLEVLGNERVRLRPAAEAEGEEAPHALSAGPTVVSGGRASVAPGFGHEKARHPRTAVGLAPGERVLLVTVDGRTPESAGMTLAELASLLVGLGCEEALNLDGGGSTSMWVRGEPEDGVVNFPCDNRRFDRRGERAVANAILVLAPDVVVADTDEAELLPPDRWSRARAGTGFLGEDYALAARGDEATARWSPKVEFASEVEVFARWPSLDPLATGATWRFGGIEKHLGQARGGGAWVSLGTVRVQAPGALRVDLSGTTKEPLAADAVRIVER